MAMIKGEFYWLNGIRVLRVDSASFDYDGHRSTRYFYGPFLRVDKMTIGIDTEGHPHYDVGATPLTEEQKKDIIAKFAKARKKGVARKFFHM